MLPSYLAQGPFDSTSSLSSHLVSLRMSSSFLPSSFELTRFPRFPRFPLVVQIVTLIQHFGRSRRRAQLQKNSREAGGYNYRDAKRKGGKRGIGGGNAIDAWEWEGSAVSYILHSYLGRGFDFEALGELPSREREERGKGEGTSSLKRRSTPLS